jgi:hypothetical protein
LSGRIPVLSERPAAKTKKDDAASGKKVGIILYEQGMGLMNKPGTGGVSRRAFLASMGAVAAGLKFAPGSVFAAEEKKLNFYNWDTYIGEDTLSDFKDATGIDVTMDLFADNDELFAKLKGGNPGYDVIVPTNDFVERMITAGMLMPLDHGKIPNIANVDPTFRDAAFPTCGAPSVSATGNRKWTAPRTTGNGSWTPIAIAARLRSWATEPR